MDTHVRLAAIANLDPANPDVDRLILTFAGPALLPGVDRDAVQVLPDQLVASRSWWVPAFQLVPPGPGDAPGTSPFSYQFVVSGHDEHGAPVIDATITVTAATVLTDDVKAQLPAGGQAVQVPLSAVTPSLTIPFRDAASGALTSTAVPADSVTPDGDRYTIVFRIRGDLARAAYGSLSVPGYQSEPVRLSVQFSFAATELIEDPPVQFLPPGQLLPPVRVQPPIRVFPPVRVPFPDPPIVVDPHPILTNEPPPDVLAPVPARRDLNSSPVLVDPVLVDTVPRLPIQQPVTFRPIPVPVTRWMPVTVTRDASLDVLMPCTSHGSLYVNATDSGHPAAIGCQDAMALGQLPSQLYLPMTNLDNLDSADYQVLASVSRPSVYLLVPRRYRVGRASPGLAGVVDWAPLIRWIQEFDATLDSGLPCLLQASLEPDITPASLAAAVAALSAVAGNPTVLLPTTPGSNVTGFTVKSWNTSSAAIQTSLDGDAIQFNANLAYSDAVILNGMLAATVPEGQLVGNAVFALSDGSTVGPVELHVDVTRLTGPWPAGPVSVQGAADGATATVTNHAETTAALTQILAAAPDGSTRVLADNLNLTLASAGSVSVPLTAPPPAAAQLIVGYVFADATSAVIDQERVYIEDLHTTVTVINDGTLSAAGITSVDISARLDGDTESLSFTMTPATPFYQFDIVQPLVADRQADTGLLHLTATAHKPGQPDATTGDFVADLHKGVLIQLSAVLATPPPSP